MTSPKDKHRDAEIFREAHEILISMELFDAWERKRFRDEHAVRTAQKFGTGEHLRTRLRAAVGRLEGLQPQHRATFPMDKAKRLLGGG